MYWLHTNNLIDLALSILLTCAGAAGGWLMVSHAFRLRHIERVIAGLETGFNYAYMDIPLWQSRTPDQRGNFQKFCVDITSERGPDPGKNYCVLTDINACKE